MRKSVFYLCAAIAAATVIAGCSKSSPETEGNEPTPPSTEDSTTTAMTLEDWCGTYEVQCTKTIVFTHSETGNNIYELVDEPQTFEITISMTGTSEADSTVEFTGWSALDFTEEFTIYPGLMKLTPEGSLKILANGRTEEKRIRIQPVMAHIRTTGGSAGIRGRRHRGGKQLSLRIRDNK